MLFTKQTKLTIDAALRDAQHARRREARLDAIERLGEASGARKSEAAAQLQLLLQDEQAEIRQAAAVALGELEHVGALEQLAAVCREDDDPLARQGAVIALGAISGSLGPDRPDSLDSTATAALRAACADPDADVRFQAVAAVAAAALPRQESTAALRRLLNDADAEVRGSAAAALADLQDHSSADAVAGLLDDADRGTRVEAAVALSRLGDRRGSDILIEHLADRDYGSLVAEQLFRHPPAESALPALRRFAKRRFADRVTEMWVAAALARLGDPLGRSLLLAGLKTNKPVILGMAIELLGALGPDAGAREALEDMLENDDGSWREEIQTALLDKAKK